MNRKQLLFAYLTEFFCFIFTCLLVLMLVLFNIVTSEKYILKRLDKIDYYKLTVEEINDELGNYVIQSGLADEVMEGLVTEENIKTIVTDSITAVYKDKKYELDTTSFKEQLSKNIDKFLEDKQIIVSDRKSLDTYVTVISKVYEDELVVYRKIDILRNYYKKGKTIYMVTLGILAVLSLIFLALKAKIKRINGITLASAGMFSIFVSLFLSKIINLKEMYIYDKILSQGIDAVYSGLVTRFLVVGIICVVVALVITIIKTLKAKED